MHVDPGVNRMCSMYGRRKKGEGRKGEQLERKKERELRIMFASYLIHVNKLHIVAHLRTPAGQGPQK